MHGAHAGKMRKKVWIAQGDIILVGLRDYQDEKADVIMKFTVSSRSPDMLTGPCRHMSELELVYSMRRCGRDALCS